MCHWAKMSPILDCWTSVIDIVFSQVSDLQCVFKENFSVGHVPNTEVFLEHPLKIHMVTYATEKWSYFVGLIWAVFQLQLSFHYKACTLLFSNTWSQISDSVNLNQVVKMSNSNVIQSRYVSLNWYELILGRAVNLVANIDDIKLGQLLLSQGPYILRYQCYVETFMFLVVYNQCFHCYTVFY